MILVCNESPQCRFKHSSQRYQVKSELSDEIISVKKSLWNI
jgi:hypothetical protein